MTLKTTRMVTNIQRNTSISLGMTKLPKINHPARTIPPQRLMTTAPPNPKPTSPFGRCKDSNNKAIPIPVKTPPKIAIVAFRILITVDKAEISIPSKFTISCG